MPRRECSDTPDEAGAPCGECLRFFRDKSVLVIGVVLDNGKNVYPEEIENLIMRVDCVQEVVVFGVKNEKGDEHSLGAEVYLNTPTPEKEVKDLIAKELKDQPTYKKISKVIVRDEPFEKTSSNKIIRPKRD